LPRLLRNVCVEARFVMLENFASNITRKLVATAKVVVWTVENMKIKTAVSVEKEIVIKENTASMESVQM
jgi:hypothetical protein